MLDQFSRRTANGIDAPRTGYVITKMLLAPRRELYNAGQKH